MVTRMTGAAGTERNLEQSGWNDIQTQEGENC